MVLLSSVGHMVLMSSLLAVATSSPATPRRGGGAGLTWEDSPGTWDQLSQSQGSRGSRGPERRQLGDMEFSMRYAEYLRAKAKHQNICIFLQRMQAIKKSVLGEDVDMVNDLLTQYRCPGSFTWTTDL